MKAPVIVWLHPLQIFPPLAADVVAAGVDLVVLAAGVVVAAGVFEATEVEVVVDAGLVVDGAAAAAILTGVDLTGSGSASLVTLVLERLTFGF